MAEASKLDAYPGLIRGPWQGSGWTVLECNDMHARTSPQDRMLAIPKALTRCQALIRYHEMRHIKRGLDISTFGPEPRCSFRKMCEEIAIETESLNDGFDIREARDGLDWANFPEPQDRLGRAIMTLQLIGSVRVSKNPELKAWYARVNGGLDFNDQYTLEHAFTSLFVDTSPANCDHWADALSAIFAPPPQRTDPGLNAEEMQKIADAEAEAREAEEQKRDKDSREEAMDPDSQVQHQTPQEHFVAQYGGSITEALAIHWHVGGKAQTRMVSAAWRPSDASGPLRYPLNAMRPDGRPFGQRAQGGTLIIDVSSSMHWNAGEVEAAIKSLPNLTVTVYCGSRDPEGSRMCVVGHKGRIAPFHRHEEPFNGGNGRSDAQAIKAAMKIGTGPYVWVSDGEVHWDDIREDIRPLMERQRVLVRTRTVKHAIDYMQYKTVPLSRTADYEVPLERDSRKV